jgi:hypothetical protein
MSDGDGPHALLSFHPSALIHGGRPFAYVRGVDDSASGESGLRGRLWFNHFGRQSFCPFAIARRESIGRRGDLFDHLCLTDPDEL